MRKPPCPAPNRFGAAQQARVGPLQSRSGRGSANAGATTICRGTRLDGRGGIHRRGSEWRERLPARTKQADGRRAQEALWRGLRLALRQVRSFRVPLATGIGDIQGARNRLRFILRADGHFDASGKDGLHCAGSSSRARAQPDRILSLTKILSFH